MERVTSWTILANQHGGGFRFALNSGAVPLVSSAVLEASRWIAIMIKGTCIFNCHLLPWREGSFSEQLDEMAVVIKALKKQTTVQAIVNKEQRDWTRAVLRSQTGCQQVLVVDDFNS